MDDHDQASAAAREAYILLLLSDANLPTGSFVASSGLESYIKHGFFSSTLHLDTGSPFVQDPNGADQAVPPRLATATINFLQDSLNSYSRSVLPFIRAVHEALEREATRNDGGEKEDYSKALEEILQLDELYETMTLNHVARRASKAQGVALLTLYTKGFSRPAWIPEITGNTATPAADPVTPRGYDAFVEQLKMLVRRGSTHGHLPICWAVLAVGLKLAREKSQQLHVFLNARALLSASVRLNTIGPYAAQQLLLHVVKPLVDEAMEKHRDLKLSFQRNISFPESTQEEDTKGKPKDWELDDDGEGPACTWPLGEILASRHDLQHSRIFNS